MYAPLHKLYNNVYTAKTFWHCLVLQLVYYLLKKLFEDLKMDPTFYNKVTEMFVEKEGRILTLKLKLCLLCPILN